MPFVFLLTDSLPGTPRLPLLAGYRKNMSNSSIHLVPHDPILTLAPAHPTLHHILGRTCHQAEPRATRTSLIWPTCNPLYHMPQAPLARTQPLNPSADPYRLKIDNTYHNIRLHNFIDPDHLTESAARVVVYRWPLMTRDNGLRSRTRIAISPPTGNNTVVSQRKAC